jgi:hypothetical protein
MGACRLVESLESPASKVKFDLDFKSIRLGGHSHLCSGFVPACFIVELYRLSIHGLAMKSVLA